MNEINFDDNTWQYTMNQNHKSIKSNITQIYTIVHIYN